MNMLVLDLKTVPDPGVGKRLLALEKFGDAEAVLAMKTLRVAGHQSAAVPVQQRRVVAAALVIASANEFTVAEFIAGTDEARMLTEIEQRVHAAATAPVWGWESTRSYRAQLLSRALATGVAMPALLAAHGPQSLAARFGFAPDNAPLAELAAVHGLPHRLGLRTVETEAAHIRGDHQQLGTGSAADALIAYLLAIALQAATGEIDEAARQAARRQVCDWLQRQTSAHWQQFHAVWKAL